MKKGLFLEADAQEWASLHRLLRENGYEVAAIDDGWRLTRRAQAGQGQTCSICEDAPLGIFHITLGGKLLSINAAGARMHKFGSPQEMIAAVNRTSVFDALCPAGSYCHTLRDKGPASDAWHVYEDRLLCKDGSSFDCSYHIRTVRDAAGQAVAMEGFFQDVSERKRAEAELRLTRFAIEKTGDQAFWMEEDGRLFFVNDAACRSLGYSREELLQMAVSDFAPDFPAQVFAAHWQKLKERGSLTLESCHRARDGRIYPVEVRANYLEFDGKAYNCAFVTDLSERRQKDRTLHLARLAMDNTADQVFWIMPDGGILYANRAACECLGYPSEELVGMSILDVDVDFSPKKMQESWENLKTGKTLRFETRHRSRQGRVYPVEVRSNYLSFNGQEFCCALISDVSERKAAEEVLRRSEERFRQLMEMLPIAAYSTDTDGRVTFYNRSAREFWQREPERDQDRWCGACRLRDIDGRLIPPERSPLAVTLKTGADCQGQEVLVEHPDGTTSCVVTYPERLVDDYGRVDGGVNLLVDITERKKAEQRLRQANLILENSSTVLFRWKAQTNWPVAMVTDNVTRFGYVPDELLSGKVPFVEMIHPEDRQRVASEMEENLARGIDRFQQEYRIVSRAGEVFWVDDRTVVERDVYGSVTHFQGVLADITDRKRTEAVITARMRLLQHAATHTLDELLEATLDEAEELTGSRIGFIVFIEEDQQTLTLQNWSTRTKQEYCTAQGKGLHFPLAEAGVWVDCVHQRCPVIHNDYMSLPHRKGLPPGHAPLIRELLVPVFRHGMIVAIVAVGNKPQDYTPHDVEAVSLLADLAWTITERKQAEEALRESEQRYRSIVDHAPFGISHSTRDGKLIRVNPALAAILKYDSAQELQEIVNRTSIQDVLFPDPATRVPLVEKIFSEDNWYVFNNRLRCKDGSFVICRVHSRQIMGKDGQSHAFESYQENITEQVQAEQALRESEEKFRVMAETSPMAIAIFQGDRYLYINPAMERLFGYGAEEWQHMGFWEWAHPEIREKIRARGYARLSGAPEPGQYEARYVTKAGKEGYVLLSAGVIDYQGRPAGVGTFLDITQRKETEELVRASLTEKEVLLREIHHRVKNNLQVVSSLLFLQSQKFTDPQLQECFLESQSRICSMALAHEQLYQSKNLAEVSIRSYVENLVDQLQNIFQPADQAIDCRLAVEDVRLDIEKVVPCGLLITELLSNAYKHAFVDGRRGRITVSLKQFGPRMALTVADDGVGFPRDLEPGQVKTLGLQLVAALVSQLNGSLELEKDNGTLFRVYFSG